jgi:probable H4MPT-linked C1 transfer pathway protein
MKVAAANWHAMATWAGRGLLADFQSTLLIDTGSTTTDIIPIWLGQPSPVGRTDFGRLQSKELVYTGVRRTPICALLTEGIAAEFFATTEDAYLRLGMLDENPNCLQTADGRPATAKYAHARLSRMLGGDPVVTSEQQTHQLAVDAFARQRELIADAIAAVVSRLPELPNGVLFSGSGEFLARAAWNDFAINRDRTSLPPVKLLSMAELLGLELSAAACAYAVAKLAEVA